MQLNGSELLSRVTTFLKYSKYLPDLKRRETLTQVIEESDNTARGEQSACAGGGCAID